MCPTAELHLRHHALTNGVYTIRVDGLLSDVPDGFKDGLQRCTSVVMEINSNGGNVNAALLMTTLLQRSGRPVLARARLACSAAALLLQAADHRQIFEGGYLMFHRGVFSEHETPTQVLNDMGAAINDYSIDLVARRSGIPTADVRRWFEGTDYWISARAAVGLNLVDEVVCGVGAPGAILHAPGAVAGR